MKLLKLSIFILILLIGCNSDQNIRSYKIYKQPLIKESSQLSFDQKIDWKIPKSWVKYKHESSMRLASFQVPYYGYDFSTTGYGDVSISILDGDGGGLKANVNRWRNQLDLESQTLTEIHSSAQNKVNKLGKYQIFKIINKSNSDMAFICAVMPIEDSTIFIAKNEAVCTNAMIANTNRNGKVWKEISDVNDVLIHTTRGIGIVKGSTPQSKKAGMRESDYSLW